MVTSVAVATTTHPWTRRRASRDAQAPIRAAQPPATKSQRDARGRCTARGPMWFQDLTDLGAFEPTTAVRLCGGLRPSGDGPVPGRLGPWAGQVALVWPAKREQSAAARTG